MPARPLPLRLWWTVRDYVKRVYDNAGDDNIFFLTGGITFNVLRAAVPFFLLLLSGLGYLLDQDQTKASQAVFAFVDSLLPPSAETGQSPIHSILDDIVKARGSVGLIGLVAFIWFTTGLFGTLRSVLAEVFDIQDTRGVVGGKIFDIKITVVATVLFAAYTMLNAYVGIATNRGVQVIAGLGVRAEVIGRAEYYFAKLIALLAILAMFFALYKYLPSRRIRWQAAMMGAIFTATFFEIARNLFTAYLRSFNPGSLYTGTLYTIVVLVFWVYYSAFFFIVGGELGQVYELRRVRRQQRETFEE